MAFALKTANYNAVTDARYFAERAANKLQNVSANGLTNAQTIEALDLTKQLIAIRERLNSLAKELA